MGLANERQENDWLMDWHHKLPSSPDSKPKNNSLKIRQLTPKLELTRKITSANPLTLTKWKLHQD